MNYILGIDEAGRGPVLGPLVVAGVGINPSSENFFKTLGVKDSKKLSPKKRELLFSTIIDEALVVNVNVAWPQQIDYYVNNSSLNYLEALMMANIINLHSDETKVIIDSPQKPTSFLKILSSTFNTKNPNICCEFKADDNYIVVSCASIVAKYVRDAITQSLKEEFGDFGSGYTSDAKTIEFLKNNIVESNILRKSWKTAILIDKAK